MIRDKLHDLKSILLETAPAAIALSFCVLAPYAGLRAAAALVEYPAENAYLHGRLTALVDKLPTPQLKTFRGEHPMEDQFIELALLEQEYFRTDVPLSYELQDALHTSCTRYGIDYAAALGLIEVESGFDPNAVSPHNCYGLCQLNPRWFPGDLTPAENIDAGMAYLREQIDRYGSLEAGLQAYHDGYDTGARWYAHAVLEAAKHWQ